VEENVSDWIREEPDWETSAMPKSDPRIIYWDTKRPLFQYSDIFLNDELHPDLLQILPQDVIQEINQFYVTHQREPEESDDINERKLFSRLGHIKEDYEKSLALKEYDLHGLLDEVKEISIKEVIGMIKDKDYGNKEFKQFFNLN
jgi:hypothetical protein